MFVLNGAAHSVRRPTSDLDLTSIQIANNVAAALELVRMVLDIESTRMMAASSTAGGAVAEVVREADEYSGIRVSADTMLATAGAPPAARGTRVVCARRSLWSR